MTQPDVPMAAPVPQQLSVVINELLAAEHHDIDRTTRRLIRHLISNPKDLMELARSIVAEHHNEVIWNKDTAA